MNEPDALVQTSSPDSAETLKGSQEQPALPSDSDLLRWYIERIHRYVDEAPQMDSVPMLEKAQTFAALMQARQLERIADALDAIKSRPKYDALPYQTPNR